MIKTEPKMTRRIERAPITLHASVTSSAGRSKVTRLQQPEYAFHAIFHPLGIPVRVTSNSRAILDAAQQSWGNFQPLFQGNPLELQLGVRGNGEEEGRLAPEPTHSLEGDLLINSSDLDNFFIANLAEGRATGWVTETTANSPLYLRYFFLEAAVLSMISTLRAIAVHAACVVIGNTGVLLCGDSGAGKSTLSYGGARSGWTYVSDDASYLLLNSETPSVVGNCHKIRFRPSAAELFPEIEGRPLTPRAMGKPSIEVSLSEWPEIPTSTCATVKHIVFLNRNSVHQELISLSASERFPWFMQQMMATAASRTIQINALSRLLKSGIYELRYRDLAWAIKRIDQLVEEGR